jgi:hypothetical protein
LSAPPEPFVPEERRFKNGHALIVVGYGSPEDHARVITPVREGMKPLFELVTPMPFVAVQQMLNESARWCPGQGGGRHRPLVTYKHAFRQAHTVRSIAAEQRRALRLPHANQIEQPLCAHEAMLEDRGEIFCLREVIKMLKSVHKGEITEGNRDR